MMLTEPDQSACISCDDDSPLPGLVIRREVLERFKISQADLARLTGVSAPWLSQILKGRNPISFEFALRLQDPKT